MWTVDRMIVALPSGGLQGDHEERFPGRAASPTGPAGERRRKHPRSPDRWDLLEAILLPHARTKP